jgi:molybdenum cofactor biosynthesis enzyme MoaA
MMKKERHEALKRMAAAGSGASDNERAIALALLDVEECTRKFEKRIQEIRITVEKGITSGSIVVRRKDGKGAATIMSPVDEYAALEFCNSSLRLKLTNDEEFLVCEKLS